jgi:molybdate transport system substrate-binding protein
MKRERPTAMRAPFVLAALLLASACPAATSTTREVRVFAAASLARAFSRAQEQLDGTVTLQLSFAGSQQLALQLAHGARADVFASADERWMDDVAERGLLAETPRLFARNRLVVVTPASNPGGVEGLADLARPGVKLVLASDAVPAGRYSREVLRKLQAEFGSDFAARALANLVSEEETVQAVVAKVQLGEADAGIVYVSDVAPAVREKLRVLTLPAATDVDARYFIGLLKNAPNPAGGRALIAWLLQPAGQRLLCEHGFAAAVE